MHAVAEYMSQIAAGAGNCQQVDWGRVADAVGGGMAPMDCLMQFRNVDDPSINSRPWKDSEIEALTAYVSKHGNNWALCAEAVGNGRTPLQCISYYQVQLKF